MINLLWFGLTFIICGLFRFFFLKKEPAATPAGAIIMAIGIFLYSAMQQFPLLFAYGKPFTFILAAVWLFIVFSVAATLVDRTFQKRHLPNEIHLFAIGTWVAGTSVLGNVIHTFSLHLGFFPYVMGTLNVLLYVWYIALVLRAYPVIFRTKAKNNVHGVLLLATVSTQSIVLLLFNIFNRILPSWGNAVLISFGLILYIIGFYLIVRRYFIVRHWESMDDWKNTNCILHGAISITGLATATTGAFPYTVMLMLWVWVIAWFLIVEAIEAARAVFRINRFGFKQALAVYDVSQWSRNFTFGMLYAFTARFTINDGALLITVRNFVLAVGPWIVLLFLLYEIVLFLKAKLQWQRPQLRKKEKALLPH
ncbi:hypothetical protein [Bacillus piscicola]|uniref:hypothetical protein n=1 Tax=Bacillus piscicola TaxID=1632684 RepID=UPI001F088C20|nr:hypothetical protein [Bacillus piscicola]